MPNKLCIAISIFILLFLIYVIRNIKQEKLNIKNSMIWIVLSIGIILCIFQIDNLEKIAKILGIVTVSNMCFFLGFVFLLFVCFNITKTISIQNKKIIQLTQEVALLRKDVKK